jgi:flagellar biosynthesis/type III secretory pathway chaperone
MDTSDRFRKFAAECQTMAKLTPSRETTAVWSDLAQRWLRVAELADQKYYSNDHGGRLVKRQKRAVYSSD